MAGSGLPESNDLSWAQWRTGISCLWKFRIVAWLTRVNRGGSRLDLPPAPLTGCSHFVLMAHRSVRRECLAIFEKIRGQRPQRGRRSHCQLWRRCACGFARDPDRNAYLEAEIERLTEAISTGFARGRMRKAPQRITKI